MRLENALARKIGDVSFDNEVLILDHKRGWPPIAILLKDLEAKKFKE